MGLDFYCMAVEPRAPYVAYLQMHVPDLIVLWDRAGSAWGNWRTVLDLMGDDPAVLIEDDVILTVDFTAKVAAVVEEHPDDLVQFFSMRGKDLTVGSRWDRQFLMNQCVYYPAGMAARLASWADSYEWLPGAIEPHDLAICEALKAWRERYWIHVPNLVDHGRVRSVIDPRRSSFRQSKTFVDPELRGYPA